MRRRVRQFHRSPFETCPRRLRWRVWNRWTVHFVGACLVASMATASRRSIRSPLERPAAPSPADIRTPRTPHGWSAVREPGPVATPARLANLISAVIFADGSTISYRKPTPDGALMQTRAAADRWSGPRPSSARPQRARPAAVDACPADDPDGRPGHESTITMFFAPDSGTAHARGEYVLWRQANDSMPVVLVQHVLRDGHRPFLAYKYAVPTGSGVDSLALVPRSVLPISRADTTGAQIDVRALRDVEWRFLVILDATSHPQRIVRVHVVASLPAIDRLDRHECRQRWRSRPLLTLAPAPVRQRTRVAGNG
jgi:hypothetical protein